jgi:hypothetical protein
VNPDCVDDAECLQAEDADALMAACQAVMDAVMADEANWTITFNLAQSWGSATDKD